MRFGHFIFPSPHASEFELFGKKTTSCGHDMQRHFGQGNGRVLGQPLNHVSSSLFELPPKQLLKHAVRYQSGSN